MPISEDEFDHQNGNNVPQQSGMSKAELRRSNKPIMEKRRRARINHCLNELKTLILDAMKKDPARHSKLEKADILEMTVKHLQTIQRQQLAVAVGTDTNVLQKFKSGFNECAGEVTRFVGNIDGVESGVKQRLVAHLSNCVNGLQQITPFTFPGLSGGAGMVGASFGASPSTINVPIQDANINATGVPLVVPQVSFPPGDVNNNNGANTRIQMQGGIQLIPSRLPTGELALLVPNSSNMHFFPPAALGSSSTHQQQQPIVDSSSQHSRNENKPHPSSTLPKSSHFSAFTTVTKMHSPNVYKYNKASSPPLSPASSTTSLGEENYRKMHSPSPTAHFQTSTISASFPTPPNQSHTPLNYKIAQVPVQTQTEHQRVTSTVTDPNSISTSVNNEIKIGYQTVPIYQHNEKPRHWSVANVKIEKQLTPEGTDHEQPLSVVTSERYKIPVQYPQDTFTVHPQSSKKRTYQDISSERLLVVANFATSSPKMPKYSSDVVSSSQHTEHRSSPENIVNKSDSDLSFKSSPSTSANSSGQSTSGSSDSMWRPW